MGENTFMDKIRWFFGLRREPPKNDFRNPIWSSGYEDDDDELYTRQQIDMWDPTSLHKEMTKHMNEMFNSFGSMFSGVESFLHEGDVNAAITDVPMMEKPDDFNNSNNIRDFYLKPGYHNKKLDQNDSDVDLDGKVSSHEITGLLKQNGTLTPTHRYDNTPSGKSFCQTVITTSVKKPDGSVETRRIVKKGNEIIEETTTTTEPNINDPVNINMGTIATTGIILSELASLFKNFY